MMKSYQNKKTGKLSVLKTYSLQKSEESFKYLCYDIMVPILIDSYYVNKFKNIFIKDKVFISLC